MERFQRRSEKAYKKWKQDYFQKTRLKNLELFSLEGRHGNSLHIRKSAAEQKETNCSLLWAGQEVIGLKLQKRLEEFWNQSRSKKSAELDHLQGQGISVWKGKNRWNTQVKNDGETPWACG